MVYFFAFFYLICVFISLFFDVVGIWSGILIIWSVHVLAIFFFFKIVFLL